MAEYRFEIKVNDDGIKLGSSAKIPFSQGDYGNIFWTSLNRAKKSQILSLNSKFSDIKGFEALTKQEQDDVTTTLSTILTSVTPVKRGRSPSNKSSRKKKKQSVKPATKKTATKKKQKKEKDPNAPKRGLTPYFLWTSRHRKRYAENNPEVQAKDVAKALGTMWNSLDEKEKQRWKDTSAKAKVVYEKQLKEYTEKGTFTQETVDLPSEEETKEEKGNGTEETKGNNEVVSKDGESKKEEKPKDKSSEKSKDETMEAVKVVSKDDESKTEEKPEDKSEDKSDEKSKDETLGDEKDKPIEDVKVVSKDDETKKEEKSEDKSEDKPDEKTNSIKA